MKVAHKKETPGEHPYGTFWFLKKNEWKIDRELLYHVAFNLGFRNYNKDVVRIDDIFIYEKDEQQFYDELKSYINLQQPDLQNDICNAYEAYIQKSGTFTIARLRKLDTEIVFKDEAQKAFKMFNNCFIEVNSKEIIRHDYDKIKGKLIWHKNIINRNWFDKSPEDYKYKEFLQLAIGINAQLMKVIGYLSHDYKGEDTGYIVTLVEQCIDPKKGGGSGKNVFGSLLKLNISLHSVAGSQVQMNEKFLQSWKFQRIMRVSDIPKRFDFSFLKEISTGTGTLKKLFKDEVSITPDMMPKLLVESNFSYDDADGGLKRRIVPIEFTDFFTRCGGVDVHFGCMFPNGWSEEDYTGYDHFIALSLKTYFNSDGKIRPTELSSGGWIKQFSQKYGEITYDFIAKNIEFWTEIVEISSVDFNRAYDEFTSINNVQKKYELSAIMMNRALEEYCQRNEIEYDKDHQFRNEINSVVKGKMFKKLVTNTDL